MSHRKATIGDRAANGHASMQSGCNPRTNHVGTGAPRPAPGTLGKAARMSNNTMPRTESPRYRETCIGDKVSNTSVVMPRLGINPSCKG